VIADAIVVLSVVVSDVVDPTAVTGVGYRDIPELNTNQPGDTLDRHTVLTPVIVVAV
jgi:hypothetical protein